MNGIPSAITPVASAMNATGIGYGGIKGVSWLCATAPLVLPTYVEHQIQILGRTIFQMFDYLAQEYGKDLGLTRLLNHKVPTTIPRIVEFGKQGERGRVEIIRPDIVLIKDQTGKLVPVVTEIESAPAGFGMGHAMQVGYGLPNTAVEAMIEFLDGRPLVVFATHEWAEYTWDIASFLSALRARGVEAELWFDRPLAEVHAQAQRWTRHSESAPWSVDFVGRLRALEFDHFVKGFDSLPTDIGNPILYRFGYFDNLGTETLETMRQWIDGGATIVNPLHFFLESKVSLAASQLTAQVLKTQRDDAGKAQRYYAEERVLLHRFGAKKLAVLDRHIAETHVLDLGYADITSLVRNRQDWLTKFAGYDHGNQSWGARSVDFGGDGLTREEWIASLSKRLTLDHPVVAQRYHSSVKFDVQGITGQGTEDYIRDASIRITPILYRWQNGLVKIGGIFATFRHGLKVHGATDCVMAPVVFAEEVHQ